MKTNCFVHRQKKIMIFVELFYKFIFVLNTPSFLKVQFQINFNISKQECRVANHALDVPTSLPT